MVDSIREEIFQAIENVLRSVPGIGTVVRGEIDPLMIQNYHAASINPGTDTVITQDLNTVIDRQLTVFTFLWIRTQSNVIMEAEAFLPKVQKALAADYTLGGLVKDISEELVQEPFPLSEDISDAGVILQHAVIYRVNRQDPYSQI